MYKKIAMMLLAALFSILSLPASADDGPEIRFKQFCESRDRRNKEKQQFKDERNSKSLMDAKGNPTNGFDDVTTEEQKKQEWEQCVAYWKGVYRDAKHFLKNLITGNTDKPNKKQTKKTGRKKHSK